MNNWKLLWAISFFIIGMILVLTGVSQEITTQTAICSMGFIISAAILFSGFSEPPDTEKHP